MLTYTPRTRGHAHVRTHMHTHMSLHMSLHTDTHTHTHAHAHTQTHTQTHTHTRRRGRTCTKQIGSSLRSAHRSPRTTACHVFTLTFTLHQNGPAPRSFKRSNTFKDRTRSTREARAPSCCVAGVDLAGLVLMPHDRIVVERETSWCSVIVVEREWSWCTCSDLGGISVSLQTYASMACKPGMGAHVVLDVNSFT